MILNTIREQFSKNFEIAIQESTKNKFILSGNVGIGKTEILRNLNDYTNESVVICFPTHDLKEEFFHSKKNLRNCICTPRTPSNFAKFLKSLSDEDNQTISYKVKEKFPEYYKEMDNIISFPDSTILTTHDAFLLSAQRFKQNTIIFDEVPDLIFGQIQNESIFGLEELRYLITANRPKDYEKLELNLRSFQETIRSLNSFATLDQTGSVIKKIKNPIHKELRKKLLTIKDEYKFHRTFKNICKILQGDYIFVNFLLNTLSVYNKFDFQDNKKYICFSATPNKKLFDHNKFTFLKTSDLELKSEIIHIPFNTSKMSLATKDNQKKINSMIKELKIDYTISYKDCCFKNQVFDLYFGNSEGTNKYENHSGNFAIIGTPMNNMQYIFDQMILFDKINFSKEDLLMINKEIKINNQKIEFRTFQSNWLTEQHLNQIHSDLVQMIGRLRPYTTDNKKIYLFSKLPVLC